MGSVVDADLDEVIFTSGATESDNIAILGLSDFANQTDRRHIISTRVEHKAVLEPLEQLQSRGFDVTLLDPLPTGAIDPTDLLSALRPDTVMVSVMHVNNRLTRSPRFSKAMRPTFTSMLLRGLGKSFNFFGTKELTSSA